MDDVNTTQLRPSDSSQQQTGAFSGYMDLQEATRSGVETTNQMQRTNAPSKGADYTPLHPSTLSWEVERSDVSIEKIIGKGSFGQVAKGTAKDLRGRPGQTTVAVKMLNCEILFFLLNVCYHFLWNNK